MSGIAGIIHFDGAPVAPGLVEKMTSAMDYRGPDGINHWVKGSVALGQCMLRTTPESLEETQPLTNEDESLVLVMDGRVDNWEELRRELLARGAVLRNRSDAELVLRSYETWGRDCLPHIDGDFALVIWDVRRQEAFCARDRMGNKPFTYHWDGKTLTFSSELRAILGLPWVPRVLNEGMLAELLAAEWHSRDETLWSGIQRLVAAHRMTAGRRGTQLAQYWEPNLWETLPYTKDEEYIEHYRELLTDSVRRLSRSHRPVAIDVSGGLDSSSVFCVAEYLLRSNMLPAPCIEGYTLDFTGDSGANELAYARAVGEHVGIQVHEIPPSRMPLSWFAERAQSESEFPGFPNSAMFINIWREAAARGSRVTLSGEVADLWLQGSRVYYAEELAQWRWRTLYECFRVDATIFGFSQAIRWLIRHGLFPLLPSFFQEGLRHVIRRRRESNTGNELHWLSAPMQKAIALRRLRNRAIYTLPVRSAGQLELLEAAYCAFITQIKESDERLSALLGLEIRQPFCDAAFVQYAFSTPARLRLRGDRSKYIHVRSLNELMPEAILQRKDKAEFSIMFSEHLNRMEETLVDTLPGERADWVSREGMAGLWRSYLKSPQTGLAAWALWSIYGCDKVNVPLSAG